MLKLLRRGGRYTSSGAIAGPLVSLDMRDMYLKDISLIGTTAWDETVSPDLIRYMGRRDQTASGEDLSAFRHCRGETAFSRKDHVGDFVLIPPDL